ncbi:hypothetical protein BGW38_005623, partial [Lunasporangiospora selenospora]
MTTSNTNRMILFCLVDGESTAFPVQASTRTTVGELKDLIKVKKANLFHDVDADELSLWRVSVPVLPKKDRKDIWLADVPSKEELDETDDIADVFTETPPSASSPPSGDLHADIKRIREKFFAAGSKHAEFLISYVQGKGSLPITEDGLRGLPMVLRRGAVDSEKAQPSLLFLDLPEPPSSADDLIPERFKSNILLGVLETMKAQDLPVFGVSGCGKTRTMVEMLFLQWGFYFNAAKSDLGSFDLSRLADFIDSNTIVDSATINTRFAKNATLLLFLSRLMILNYCLSVPNCRQTFSSARWALLQVCPHMFKDVFMHLSNKLCDLMKGRALLESILVSIVREEFELSRDKLSAHNYPNFSSDSKLRLVIDEAQILSDKNPSSFVSSMAQGDPRPMLSPVLHSFRTVGLPDELKIIYAGTGLSIRTLHWAMGSGDGIKEYGSNTFPYLEFPGWTSADSVQAYIDRLKEQLLDEGSKRRVDTLIPPEAVKMLHTRMRGRFRPIVTGIEGILETGEWETAINNTEAMISSWADRHRRGNLCGELIR